MSEVERMGKNLLGHVVLCFNDGTKLRIDPYATGGRELIERVDKADGRFERL